MSQIGVGAMIHYLGGGSKHGSDEYVGREIVKASMTEDKLTLTFSDGVGIDIWDNGQSCCEHRYMRTDDDVQSLVGRKLRSITAKAGPSEEGDYGECHEVCFVEVQTDGGHITISNHNEHNGYYGGFGLKITEHSTSTENAQ